MSEHQMEIEGGNQELNNMRQMDFILQSETKQVKEGEVHQRNLTYPSTALKVNKRQSKRILKFDRRNARPVYLHKIQIQVKLEPHRSSKRIHDAFLAHPLVAKTERSGKAWHVLTEKFKWASSRLEGRFDGKNLTLLYSTILSAHPARALKDLVRFVSGVQDVRFVESKITWLELYVVTPLAWASMLQGIPKGFSIEPEVSIEDDLLGDVGVEKKATLRQFHGKGKALVAYHLWSGQLKRYQEHVKIEYRLTNDEGITEMQIREATESLGEYVMGIPLDQKPTRWNGTRLSPRSRGLDPLLREAAIGFRLPVGILPVLGEIAGLPRGHLVTVMPTIAGDQEDSDMDWIRLRAMRAVEQGHEVDWFTNHRGYGVGTHLSVSAGIKQSTVISIDALVRSNAEMVVVEGFPDNVPDLLPALMQHIRTTKKLLIIHLLPPEREHGRLKLSKYESLVVTVEPDRVRVGDRLGLRSVGLLDPESRKVMRSAWRKSQKNKTSKKKFSAYSLIKMNRIGVGGSGVIG